MLPLIKRLTSNKLELEKNFLWHNKSKTGFCALFIHGSFQLRKNFFSFF